MPRRQMGPRRLAARCTRLCGGSPQHGGFSIRRLTRLSLSVAAPPLSRRRSQQQRCGCVSAGAHIITLLSPPLSLPSSAHTLQSCREAGACSAAAMSIHLRTHAFAANPLCGLSASTTVVSPSATADAFLDASAEATEHPHLSKILSSASPGRCARLRARRPILALGARRIGADVVGVRCHHRLTCTAEVAAPVHADDRLN
uniref:Uncharacterized protein n=1 Tax=Oryza nivara TaxID=4536 RepID=A0A0E0HSY6_ORYNI